jgi:hypothetical protein
MRRLAVVLTLAAIAVQAQPQILPPELPGAIIIDKRGERYTLKDEFVTARNDTIATGAAAVVDGATLNGNFNTLGTWTVKTSGATGNGNFETLSGDANNPFSTWSNNGGCSPVEIDSTSSRYAGSYSCRMVKGSGTAPILKRSGYTTSGNTYRMTCRYKTSGATASYTLWNGPNIVFPQSASWRLAETTWVSANTGFVLNNDNAWGATDTIWVDDVEVKDITDTQAGENR